MILLDNITKTYGPVRALVGVSCTFASGSITTLRGPNGSGKSTLLTIIGTMTRPTSGWIDHGDLGPGKQDVRASLGWVGHESLCYPDLTGRANIELAASLHGCDPIRAFARAAERFELHVFANRPVRTYSRGQRQRMTMEAAPEDCPLVSVRFAAQLKAAGVPCDFYTVQDGIHGVINWEKNPDQHAYKAVLVEWLRKTLIH